MAQAWPTTPIKVIVAFIFLSAAASLTLWRVWLAISSRPSSVSQSVRIVAGVCEHVARHRQSGHRDVMVTRFSDADVGQTLLLLVNECFSRGANSRDLDDDFPVLCPAEVRRFRRLRIEGTGRISLQLAFVPLLATTEVERTGEDHDCSRLIGMPMRRVLPPAGNLTRETNRPGCFGSP